jgi:hypothetical protein
MSGPTVIAIYARVSSSEPNPGVVARVERIGGTPVGPD